jgi:hypothetical protein
MVMTPPSRMVIGEANDRTTEGVRAVSGTAATKGGPGPGGRGGASRVVTASLSLLIARHGRRPGVREACRVVEAGRASDSTHSRVAVAGSGAGWRRGGPEFGGAAGGEGALLAGSAGSGERVEGLLDAVGGEVALAEIADLCAGEPVG